MIDNFKKNLPIHFFYIVIFLIVAIIFIATGQWTDKPGFTSYLSNAATFTSLVLALIAIFYSFIANDSIGKNLGGVSEAVKQIDNLSSNIDNSIASIEEAKKTSEEIKENISKLVIDLNAKIISLESSVSDVKEFRDLLDNSIRDGFTKVANDINSLRSEKFDKSISEDIEFSNVTSFLLLQVMYLISYSCRKSKKFYFARIFNSEEESYFLLGVLGSLEYANKISVERYDNDQKSMKDWYFVFEKVNYEHEKIEFLLDKKIEESKSKDIWRAELNEALKNIDNFPQKND